MELVSSCDLWSLYLSIHNFLTAFLSLGWYRSSRAMALCSQRYTLLNDEKEFGETSNRPVHSMKTWLRERSNIITLALLSFSLSLNIILSVQSIHPSGRSPAATHTKYGEPSVLWFNAPSIKYRPAHLALELPIPWLSKSPYYGEEEAMADALWDQISIDNGTVALSDAYVQAMGLPVSQRFPWDNEKGIYLLNGFHSMHCLVCTQTPNTRQT